MSRCVKFLLQKHFTNKKKLSRCVTNFTTFDYNQHFPNNPILGQIFPVDYISFCFVISTVDTNSMKAVLLMSWPRGYCQAQPCKLLYILHRIGHLYSSEFLPRLLQGWIVCFSDSLSKRLRCLVYSYFLRPHSTVRYNNA